MCRLSVGFLHPRLRARLIPLTLLFDLIPEPAGLAGEEVAVVLLRGVPGAGVHHAGISRILAVVVGSCLGAGPGIAINAPGIPEMRTGFGM